MSEVAGSAAIPVFADARDYWAYLFLGVQPVQPSGGGQTMELLWIAIGFAIGAAVTGFGVAYMLRKGDRDVPGRRLVPVMVTTFVVALLLASSQVALAQAPALEIPVEEIFTSTNDWMQTFAPIAAIGIGITIALAVLGYLGKMIAGAFKG